MKISFKGIAAFLLFVVFIYHVNVNEVHAAYGGSGITKGDVSNVVMFITFDDEDHLKGEDPPVQPGDPTGLAFYDAAYNTGENSVKKYYDEVSYGQLAFSSHFPGSTNTVIMKYHVNKSINAFKPYSASNPYGYQAVAPETTPQLEQRLRVELIDGALNYYKTEIDNLAANGVNLDVNHDGFIDCISFIIAGDGYIQGEPKGILNVAYASSIYNTTFTTNQNLKPKRYLFLRSNTISPTFTSTATHEMFHVLGAPDAYAPNAYGSAANASYFKPMGSYELTGPGSAHMSMYMKETYGEWVNIPEISTSQHYTLNPVTSPDHNAVKIKSPYSSTEYIIAEFRKKENNGAFEKNIQEGGLLVYRINTNHFREGTSGAQSHADLEQYAYRVDGTTTEVGHIPYENGVNDPSLQMVLSTESRRTSLGDNTNPRLFLSDGSFAGISIMNVTSRDGATIEFDVQIHGADAAVPNITAQPTSFSVHPNDHVNLSVTAASEDGGTLTYQWYSNTVDSNANGTLIPGETAASFTPPTDTIGTQYYYAVITNTNNNVTGSKTASITSNTAAVTVSTTPSLQGAVSIHGPVTIGSTLLADTSKIPPQDSDHLTYSWMIDHVVVGTNKTFVIPSDSSLLGKTMTLTVTSPKGSLTATSAAICKMASPNAPTNAVVNDTDNTFGFSEVNGYTIAAGDYEYSTDNGTTWRVVQQRPIHVGNVEIPAGYFQVRVKGDQIRDTGLVLKNMEAFTAINSSNGNTGTGNNGNNGNSGNIGTGNSTIPSSPTPVQKSIDEQILDQVKNGSNPVIHFKDSSISILGSTLLTAMEAGQTVTFNDQMIEMDLTPEHIKSLHLKSNDKITIRFAKAALTPNDKVDRTQPVNRKLLDLAYTISMTMNGIGIQELDHPFTVIYNIEGLNLTESQKQKLTGIRYSDHGTVHQLSGTMISSSRFAFQATELSTFGIFVTDNLLSISTTVGHKDYWVNGKVMETNAAPIIIHGRTMVPIRYISEAFGAKVMWNDKLKKLTISLDDKTLDMTIGATLPGMDTAPEIINHRTFVPLRYISEQFNANVIWNGQTQTIEISK